MTYAAHVAHAAHVDICDESIGRLPKSSGLRQHGPSSFALEKAAE